VKYAFIRDKREEFELKRMCRVLQVSRSGYYDWARREESKRSQQDRALLKEIRKVHEATQGGLRCHQVRIPTQIGTHSAGKSTLVPIEIGTCSDANRHPCLG
jgi:hypothetical protein